MDIKQIFEETIKYGYNTRKSKKNGLLEWQSVKEQYINNKDTFIINNNYKLLCESLNYMREESDNDHERVKIMIDNTLYDNKIECDHFMIQLFRIPIMCNYKLPLVKLLQMGYNIGQLEHEIKNNNHKISEYYESKRLGLLETYYDDNEKN